MRRHVRKEYPTAKCEWCGGEFSARRSWQRFCRPSHKVMAWRKRNRK